MQLGLEPSISSTDSTFVLEKILHRYTGKRNKIIALFLDISKAFDRVNHFVIGKELLSRNIPPDMVLFLMSYLRNQKARVVWNGICGKYLTVEEGVRQGGILSPFLFKLYMDTLIRNVNKLDVGCRVGTQRANILAYADDLVLLAPDYRSLDSLYCFLKSGLDGLNMILNVSKSKCMMFSKTGVKDQGNIILGDDVFEIVDTFKFLGHYITSKLTDTKDIQIKLNSFYGKCHSLHRNFCNLNSSVLLFLFKAYCIPDYGIALWNHDNTFRSQNFKSFQIAYNKAVKRILNVPSYSSSHIAAELCDLLMLNHHVSYVQARYLKRILRSPNTLIKSQQTYLKSGLFFKSACDNFNKTYDVRISDNDLLAIQARVARVQRLEERSRLCPFFGF